MPLFCPTSECSIVKLQSVSTPAPLDGCVSSPIECRNIRSACLLCDWVCRSKRICNPIRAGPLHAVILNINAIGLICG